MLPDNWIFQIKHPNPAWVEFVAFAGALYERGRLRRASQLNLAGSALVDLCS
jgi:hypothetical protein